MSACRGGSPSSGKTVKKGGKLTFKAKLDPASEASGVFVLVSKSKKTGADGLISDGMYMRTMQLSGGSYTNTVEKYPALTSWFLNRPGTYYWQAYAIDCSDGTDDCNIESRVRRFRIK